MSERIDPVRAMGDRRVWIRRDADREVLQATVEDAADDHAAEASLPVPVTATPEQPDPRAKDGFVAFVAQVLGQPGQKKGLRGGPETLEKARSAYLETEWSGPSDRRPARGKITKTEI